MDQNSQSQELTIASRSKSPDCRRRNQRCHQAILTAAAELLEEKGFAGVSIEAIAARAGVGKQTIYRWWPNKTAVMLEAYAACFDEKISLPDTGSVKADLHQILQQLCVLITQTPAGQAIAGLIAEAQTDLEVAQMVREHFVARRRAVIRTVLERGIERGELRSTVDLDLAIDSLCGPLWYRLLLNHAPLNEAFTTGLIAQLLCGIQQQPDQP